jgi:hypothetical protein
MFSRELHMLVENVSTKTEDMDQIPPTALRSLAD